MENSPFFYKVNICYQKAKNHLTCVEEIESVEREFKDLNPIKARIAAFSFFTSYIETLLDARNSKYVGIEDAYDKLKDIFRPRSTSPSKYEGFPDSIGKHCEIELVVNHPIHDDDTGETHRIFQLADFDVLGTDLIDLLIALQIELNYYKHFKLDTGDLETSEISYCFEDDDIQSYSFLKVPLLWAGKEVNPENLTEYNGEPIAESIQSIIDGGESDIIEFKPSLVYHFRTEQASIVPKEKVAISICAFANSKSTCLLCIGVNDDGIVEGLEPSDFKISTKKNPKDFFWLEFSEMLNQFFGNRLANRLEKKFIEIDGKTIFAVKVLPSDEPLFMRKYINKTPEYKFYYREGASSKEIKDIREIVKFCLERFGSK